MKICSVCKKELELGAFGKNASKKDGLNDACRGCRKNKSKLDYEKRKDSIKAANNAYYHNNKDVYYSRKERHHEAHTEEYYATMSNIIKVCNICKQEKNMFEFARESSRADGFKPYCKLCQNEMNREYRQDNKQKENARSKSFRQNNKEKVKKYSNQYKKYKYHNDVGYKLTHLARTRINHALRGKGKKDASILQYLGCSIEEYKNHITSKFLEGMSWENHGDWEIDHIIPLANSSNVNEILCKFHYTNVQPLWKKDNQKKGSK